MVLFLRAKDLALAEMERITGAARDSMVGCRYVIQAWRLRWMFMRDASYTVPSGHDQEHLSTRCETTPVLLEIVASDRMSTAVKTIDINQHMHCVLNQEWIHAFGMPDDTSNTLESTKASRPDTGDICSAFIMILPMSINFSSKHHEYEKCSVLSNVRSFL